ncbi:MAG: restriction endonuclease subunit S [Candidatus Sulfotelmatobacter sp.]
MIPEDWDVSTVGHEFDIRLGKMLDAERNVGVPKPYIGNKAVQWDRIDVSNLPTVPMSRSDIERFRLRKGDLLVCEGGEVGRAALWNAPIEECYYQKALHRLRPTRGFDSKLMVALLHQWSNRGLLANYITQTSIAHLPREKFLEVPMPVPPSPEQRAIATVLSDVDGLLDLLDQLIAKKRDLEQAAMQQLLTGRTRLPGFHGEWQVRRLGSEIADLEAGVSVNSVEDDLQSGSGRLAVLKTSAVANGKFIPSECKTIAQRDLSRVKLSPRAETVIISRMNTIDLVGECGYVPTKFPDLFIPDRLWMTRLKASSRVCARWLAFVLSTPGARRLLRNIATGTSGSMKNIAKGKFLALEFAFPDPDEQAAIAAVLTDMDAELVALEQRLAKTRDIKRAMMQELLTGKTRLVSSEASHA